MYTVLRHMGLAMKNDKICKKTAILKVFPSQESFLAFKARDSTVSETSAANFIDWAFDNKIIPLADEKSLLAFIEKEKDYSFSSPPEEGYSFADLIDDLRGEKSVNTFIKELNEIARLFQMPVIQAAMITRMKADFDINTTKKRCLLRTLAFWIGQNLLRSGWNYDTLCGLKESIRLPAESSAGIRLAVNLRGRGDIFRAIRWLNDELVQSIRDLKLYYIDRDRITVSETTLFLDIPIKNASTIEEPVAGDYALPVRNGIAIAHQLAVRLDLSEHADGRKALTVAITAGVFSIDLDNQIQAILSAKFPDGSIIRMNSFAHLCCRLAEIKAIFDDPPKEVELYDAGINRVMKVWTVSSLWSFIYYDFVPVLLENHIPRPRNKSAVADFKQALYYGKGENPAISAMNKHSQNTFLILEVAKVCIARKMFHEANRILSTILAVNPRHIVARTMRMLILLNLALEQIEFSICMRFFNLAFNEGKFVVENCVVEDEEFYNEYGLVYVGFAFRIFNLIRIADQEGKKTIAKILTDTFGNEGIVQEQESIIMDFLCEKIIATLCTAETIFEKGRTLSPNGMGNRSIYWSIYSRSIRATLENNPTLFDKGKLLRDYDHIWQKVLLEFYSTLGWIDPPCNQTGSYNCLTLEQETNIFNRLFKAIEVYDNSVLLRSYIPNIKYAYATALFDFNPRLTTEWVRIVLDLLKESRFEAEKLLDSDVGIYSITTCFSQIQDADEFLSYVNSTIDFIETEFKEELKQDNSYEIQTNIKLLLLNIEENVREVFLR